MQDIVYPLDLTGVNPSNLVTNELHTTTESNFRDYFFIVPLFAPFFIDHFNLTQVINNVETPLVEGIHYTFALEYLSGTRVTGKPMYGAISLNNPNQSALLKMTYQTLGGESNANRLYVLQTLADKVYNPRITLWELVTDKPGFFPPTPHFQDLPSTFGMNDLITAINGIVTALVQGRNEAPFIHHLGDTNNPHQVTLSQLGYTLASLADVAAHTANDKIVTPAALANLIQSIQSGGGGDLTAINAHLLDHDNPHMVTLAQLGFGLATPAEAVEHTLENKLLTPASLTNLIQSIQAGSGLDTVAVQALIDQAISNLPPPPISDTILGPKTLYTGSEQCFKISNYDLEKDYILTTTGIDEISIEEELINIKCTDRPHTFNFNINGRNIIIPVEPVFTTEQKIRNTYTDGNGISGLKPGLVIDSTAYSEFDPVGFTVVNGHAFAVGDSYYNKSPSITTLTGDAEVGEGRVTIYKKPEGSNTYTQTQIIDTPFSGNSGKQGFGYSVAFLNHFLVIGHKYIEGHTTISEVRVYENVNGTYTFAYSINTGEANDGFGEKLTFAKENGSQIAIAAAKKNKIYIYEIAMPSPTLHSVIDGTNYGMVLGDNFGRSISLSNNNSLMIAIGIENYVANKGGVFTGIYDPIKAEWAILDEILVPNISNSGTSLTGPTFGYSLSLWFIEKPTLVVGEPNVDRCSIFELNNGKWSLLNELYSNRNNSNFGHSVKVYDYNTGPLILISAPTYEKDIRVLDTDVNQNTIFGCIALVKKTNFGWEVVGKLFPSGDHHQGFYGIDFSALDLYDTVNQIFKTEIFTLMGEEAIINGITGVAAEAISNTIFIQS